MRVERERLLHPDRQVADYDEEEPVYAKRSAASAALGTSSAASAAAAAAVDFAERQWIKRPSASTAVGGAPTTLNLASPDISTAEEEEEEDEEEEEKRKRKRKRRD